MRKDNLATLGFLLPIILAGKPLTLKLAEYHGSHPTDDVVKIHAKLEEPATLLFPLNPGTCGLAPIQSS